MRKYHTLIAFLLIASTNCQAQLEEGVLHNNQQKLIAQTLYIMKQLDIKIRPNVSKDSTLDIGMDTALNGNIKGYFKPGGLVIPKYDTSLRYYLHPIIALSKPIYYIFRKQKDTTQIALISSMSTVIHEMTHYLQFTDVPVDYDYSKLSPQYMNNPCEWEANAVQAYYFLFYYDKATLMQILSTEKNLRTKMAKITDAWKTYTEPNWRPSFPIIK